MLGAGRAHNNPAPFGASDQRLPALALNLNAQPASQLVHACETEVVARVRVLRLGVAEPNDQQLFSNQLLTHSKTEVAAAGPAASAADRLMSLRADHNRPGDSFKSESLSAAMVRRAISLRSAADE